MHGSGEYMLQITYDVVHLKINYTQYFTVIWTVCTSNGTDQFNCVSFELTRQIFM